MSSVGYCFNESDNGYDHRAGTEIIASICTRKSGFACIVLLSASSGVKIENPFVYVGQRSLLILGEHDLMFNPITREKQFK